MSARQINRAQVVDANFVRFVETYLPREAPSLLPLEASGLGAKEFLELFESQMMSRHLDLMARALRLEDKVFYTIGSAGHEGNVLLGRYARLTDPAFLHYRSGALVMERSRKLSGIDPVYDAALSFAASTDDPASGGRHKVWGSRPLWIIPQTSTIASHLPKAVGCALAITQARRVGHRLPVPEDSLVVCSFGDASLNHSTCQGALNAAQWAVHQGLPVPIVFVCEDNGIGISVETPHGWVEHSVHARGMEYRWANGLDLCEGAPVVRKALDSCRRHQKPVFLHLSTVRLMGHAGTDFEVDYRREKDLEAAESNDPLQLSAETALSTGLLSPAALLARYEEIRKRCFNAARKADSRPKLMSAAEVMKPLAPLDVESVLVEACRRDYSTVRERLFGGPGKLPERGKPVNLATNINFALHDLMVKYPECLIFGEDVAQKGGVYTVTRGLRQAFGSARVFNTLLDEQTILGLAQGYGTLGFLPIPEIQYLAYFHNACDQIRGEACSLQFFSNGRFANPLVMRIAGLGYQKGFGGHFHNDNSIAALRDIPGLVVGCPSRGDDAVGMLRTLVALARVNGRVSALLEPIALYMTRDLYEPGDNQWLFSFPEPGTALTPGEPRIYEPFARDLLIITYGNGVRLSLQAARRIQTETGASIRVMDLRWLVPLNEEAIVGQAGQCEGVLVVDEGRSAGVGEGVLSCLIDGASSPARARRIAGADCYTPLGPAAGTVLPSADDIYRVAREMLSTDTLRD